MGRSVIPHYDAIEVVYAHEPYMDDMKESRFEEERDFWGDECGYESAEEIPDEDIYDEYRRLYEDAIENIRYELTDAYASFEAVSEWSHRQDEQYIIVQNFALEISISEYCGAVAVSIAHRDHGDYSYYYEDQRGLREAWAKRMAPRVAALIERALPYEVMNPIGRFSNGEVLFEIKEVAA